MTNTKLAVFFSPFLFVGLGAIYWLKSFLNDHIVVAVWFLSIFISWPCNMEIGFSNLLIRHHAKLTIFFFLKIRCFENWSDQKMSLKMFPECIIFLVAIFKHWKLISYTNDNFGRFLKAWRYFSRKGHQGP